MNNRKLVVILMIIVAILIIALVGAIIYIVAKENKNSNNTVVVNNNKTENTTQNEADTNNNIDEPDIDDEQTKAMAIKSFNAQFETYKKEDNSSNQIKALISSIETNNATREDDHKINLSTDGITKVDQLLSDKKYKVEFLTDVEGYINEVIITENGANTGTSQTPNQTPSGTSDLQAAIFNAKFNNYIGNITGSKINDLLRIATESVTNDPSHPITINSNTITDLSEIMPTETYMITPAYDSAGYINTLNIDKIM